MARRHERPAMDFGTPAGVGEREELDRFLTSDRGPVQVAGLELRAVRLDAISPDPDQPRKATDAATLQELADSIRQQGVIQPIEVEPAPEQPSRFIIVHGERRWRAATMAGLVTIPAIIRPARLDRTTRLVRQLIENLQREDLNDMDRASGLVSLREMTQATREADAAQKGIKAARATWEEVGAMVGLTKGRISQLLGLLALPEPIQQDVRAGKLTEYDTRPYRGLSTDQQVALHQVRQMDSLTPQQVQQAARLLRQDASRPVADAVRVVTQPPPPPPTTVAPPVSRPAPEPPPVAPATALPEPAEAELAPDARVLALLAAMPTAHAAATVTAALRALLARPDLEMDALAGMMEVVAGVMERLTTPRERGRRSATDANPDA